MVDDLKNHQAGDARARMKPQVTVDVERIRADLVHVFVEHGTALLTSVLTAQVPTLVAETILSSTVESCHAERLAMQGKAQRVAEAVAGMEPIFGSLACNGFGGLLSARIGQRVRHNNQMGILKSYNLATRTFEVELENQNHGHFGQPFGQQFGQPFGQQQQWAQARSTGQLMQLSRSEYERALQAGTPATILEFRRQLQNSSGRDDY